MVAYEPVPDRVELRRPKLAVNWLRLGRIHRSVNAASRSSSPTTRTATDDSATGSVWIPPPAWSSCCARSKRAGYGVDGHSRVTATHLVEKIRRGPTNAATHGRKISVTLTLTTYRRFFDGLPAAVRRSVTERWGEPRNDPFHLAASDAFAIPAFECGNVVIGLQPARGYNIDPQSTYHDPDLVPPARLPRVLRVAARRQGRARRDPRGQARQPRMAAGQGAGARRDVLSGSSLRSRCRTSIRSSSTTPARAPRPSAGRRPSSSTTSRRRSRGPRPTARSPSWSCSSTSTSRRPAWTRAG